MICECGWKFNEETFDKCPYCGNEVEEDNTPTWNGLKRTGSLSRNQRLNPIGKKRRRRIEKRGSEYDFFKEVFEDRKPEGQSYIICQNKHCDNHLTPSDKGYPNPQWFHHIHSKSARPDLRYHEPNLVILCPPCHTAIHDNGIEGSDVLLPARYINIWYNPPKESG